MSYEKTLLAQGAQVLLEQSQALALAAQRLDDGFVQSIQLLRDLKGHLVVTGVGKSGLVGKKIAATLSSTGTPAFWMHPTDAFHGDLGSVTQRDAALLISYSGETEELIKLIAPLRRTGVQIIAMTGAPQSSLARLADIHLNVAVARESCPHNLAPTTSTTLAMAMGDALSVVLTHCRGFAPEDFARYHPGGSLGRALADVRVVMRSQGLPTVGAGANISEIVGAMTQGGLGLAVVVDHTQRVLGVITDGDIRRNIDRIFAGSRSLSAAELMSPKAVTVSVEAKMAHARALMEKYRVKSLPVLDDDARLVGVVDWTMIAAGRSARG